MVIKYHGGRKGHMLIGKNEKERLSNAYYQQLFEINKGKEI